MDIEQAVAEIARKHKVVLPKDEPILMFVTLQKMLLKESQDTQKQMLSEFRSAMERVMDDWNSRSKAQAEKILNGSIVAAKNAVASGAASGVGEGSYALSQAVEALSKHLEKQIQKLIRQTRITMASAVFLVLIVLITSLAAKFLF